MNDRPRPVNCRCTVTPILAPAAIVDPPILPPLGAFDPLPKLPPVAIPRKVYAEPIRFDVAHDVEHVADFTMHDTIRLRYRLVETR